MAYKADVKDGKVYTDGANQEPAVVKSSDKLVITWSAEVHKGNVKVDTAHAGGTLASAAAVILLALLRHLDQRFGIIEVEVIWKIYVDY